MNLPERSAGKRPSRLERQKRLEATCGMLLDISSREARETGKNQRVNREYIFQRLILFFFFLLVGG